jgi:crotonobetainyl-CoA:carnitine CoA-transferase CaiB-like acyl-CoA transferase
MNTPDRVGPLHGVRVFDLTTIVMGPSATQILGDLGADVIKVEAPEGDALRRIGPQRHEAMGPLYLQANRNKRSVCLDLKTAEGRDAALLLAADCDVFVSNVRPQAVQRLGLHAEALRSVNPALIHVCAVGYGEGGPGSGQPVYDDLMQAASGIAGLFQAIDGSPRYVPVNICDRIVGLYLALSIIAALHHRQRTGEGQSIEVPMFETMVQFVMGDHSGGNAFVPALGPPGYARLMSRHRGPYRTSDGWLAVVVYTDAHWRAFSALVGMPALLDTDPRYANLQARTVNAEACGQLLAGYFCTRSTDDWITALREIDLPCGKVNTLDSLPADPHVREVGLFSTVQHPTEGALRQSRFPVRFSSSPASVRRHAPRLGEHTEEVLAEVRSRRRARRPTEGGQ